MKIALLSKSLGPEAGGMLPVMRAMGNHLSALGLDIHAFGIRDKQNSLPTEGWQGAATSVHGWHGPHAFGFSPAMMAALRKFSPDLLHAHGLFHYTSIATKSYANEHGKAYMVSPHGMLDKWALANSPIKKRIAMPVAEISRCVKPLNAPQRAR